MLFKRFDSIVFSKKLGFSSEQKINKKVRISFSFSIINELHNSE